MEEKGEHFLLDNDEFWSIRSYQQQYLLIEKFILQREPITVGGS